MYPSYTTEAGNGSLPLVLLMEDDASLGNLLAEVLAVEIFAREPVFYQVKRATSETAAQQFLTSTPPLLCVFEHHPPMMDGLRLYDQICALYGPEYVRALLISNDLPHIELIRRQLNGLQKPFELERFIQLVQAIIVESGEYRSWQRAKVKKHITPGCASEPHSCAFSLGETAAGLSQLANRMLPLKLQAANVITSVQC